MPLVAHNELPTFSRLQERGQALLSLERAQKPDIRRITNPTVGVPEQRIAALEGGRDAGITEDMVRLSVGVENIEDLKADFDNGFRAAKKIANP